MHWKAIMQTISKRVYRIEASRPSTPNPEAEKALYAIIECLDGLALRKSTGRALDASQRHIGAPSARAPLTSTMAVAGSMGDYRQALGLQRAYSASQRLI
jgi:hypothetical protein